MRFVRGPEKLPVHTSCRIFVVAEHPFRLSPPNKKSRHVSLNSREKYVCWISSPVRAARRTARRMDKAAGLSAGNAPLVGSPSPGVVTMVFPCSELRKSFLYIPLRCPIAVPYRTRSFRAVSRLPARPGKQRPVSSWDDSIAVRPQAITFRLTASIQRATVPHNSIHRRVFVMQQAQKRGQLGSYVYSYIYAPRRYDAGEVRTCSRGA